MFEHAVYSVISPEGCASILWRTADKAAEAAEAMKITAADLHGARRRRPHRPGAARRRASRSRRGDRRAQGRDHRGARRLRQARARTSCARSAGQSSSPSADRPPEPASVILRSNCRGLFRRANGRGVDAQESMLLLAAAAHGASLRRRRSGCAISIRRTSPRRSASMPRSSQELGGAETGPRAAYVELRRPPRRRLFGSRQPRPGAPFHDAQFGGRERLLGPRRLCLRHPPADGADGRRVASSRSRSATRSATSPPTTPMPARAICASTARWACFGQIVGAMIGAVGDRAAFSQSSRRKLRHVELLARAGI